MKIKVLVLSLICGVATALAFAKFNLLFLAWISLIPLLYLLYRKPSKQAFFLSWMAGFGFYAVLIYWIPAVPAHYGGLSWSFSFFIYLLFTLFLGLFWGIFGWFFCRIKQAFPRSVWLLAPCLWVAHEFTTTHFLTGFPWGLLGYSQSQNLYFLQTASVLGVYGLSFVLVLFQCGFLYAMIFKQRTPFFLALALVLVLHVVGYLGLQEVTPTSESFTGAVVQGNIPADTDFNRLPQTEFDALFQRHLDLSRQAHTQDARFIVWAELSVPLCFSCDYGIYPFYIERLSEFVQETQSTLLLGTNEIAREQEQTFYYNTAACLGPDLSPTFYHKMHLVPFGEYTPYKKIFFFIANFTHAIGELTPGTDYVLHRFQDLPFAAPICYEIIFPDIVRNFVRNGSRFLVTITNDAWYGTSSAPHQHFAIAVLRAVENRRFLLRSATTGVSGIIDPYGRILTRSQLHTAGVFMGTITPSAHLSWYSRFGYRGTHLCLTLSVLFFILALVRKRP
jgi:apolipoprotein N-acyltransferase